MRETRGDEAEERKGRGEEESRGELRWKRVEERRGAWTCIDVDSPWWSTSSTVHIIHSVTTSE